MRQLNRPSPDIPKSPPKTSISSTARGKVERIMGGIGRVGKFLGLGVLLNMGYDGGREAIHQTAEAMLRAEKTPAPLVYTHKKIQSELGKGVNADDIAYQVSNAAGNDRVQTVTELGGIFDEDQIDGDRLVISGKRHHLKVGSSVGWDRHFVVADRTGKSATDPHLVGKFVEEEGEEDISPEEGIRLALENAAANLAEAKQASASPVAMAEEQRTEVMAALAQK